ncbi:hypothetical protein POUND7_013264 [Theobroma cacao]
MSFCLTMYRTSVYFVLLCCEESKARDSKDVGGSSGRKEKRNGKQLARRGKRSATIAIGGCNDSRGYYGQEVIDNVVLLVFAANDTTSFAIAMAFKMLAQHPECYSLLLQEHANIINNKRPGENLVLEDVKKMTYTWQAARESMRLFPPIFGSFRKAVAGIEYQGFTTPKGWKVLWTAYGTHYCGVYFQDPQRVDPSRFEEFVPPYVFLPFGGGPSVCAGYQLAKLNILIFVHYVVTRYNWSLIYPDESITMAPLPFPSQGMPVKISPKLFVKPHEDFFFYLIIFFVKIICFGFLLLS